MNPADFLDEAVGLSLRAVHEGTGGPFGAVIIRNGRIIARGQNRVLETNDPTAHAEINAIREACRALATYDLKGCELVSSCEPCPMCLAAIYWARLDSVTYAATRHDAAAAGFDDETFYREFALPPESRALPCRHHPHSGALDAFRAWTEHPGRKPY
jgi:tRNA(Arg) A34 adenosine deaminase TadA